MFKEKVFPACQVTGFVEIEIQFCFWYNEPRTFKKTFKTERDASRYIQDLKIDYLLFHLGRFVSDCKDLMDTGQSYATNGKKMAYETCMRGLQHFQDKPLHTIAGYVVKMEPFFKQILPGQLAPKYNEMYQMFIRIMAFSQAEQNPIKTEELCLKQ